MRFKTDENVHPELAARLRTEGHDAVSVHDQGMRGIRDPDLAEVCRAESRALDTLDAGFSDIRTYPPEEHPGIVVLRLQRQSRDGVLAAWTMVSHLLQRERLDGALWIVDEARVRIRRSGASGG
jgi:predicted nuclease of predicted toxin-antitoxin system